MGDLENRLEDFKSRVLGRQINEDTYTIYESWIRRFEKWVDTQDKSIDEGCLLDFDGYLESPFVTDYPWSLSKGGRKAPDSYGYNTRLVAISAIKLWLELNYNVDIGRNPQDVCKGDKPDFSPEYLPKDEIDRVINEARIDEFLDDDVEGGSGCQAQGCCVAFQLGYDAIMRASEIIRVKPEDIDLQRSSIYVHASKGSESKEVSLREETIDMVADYLSKYDFDSKERIFKNSYGDPWQADRFSTHVLRTHHEAGIHAIGRHSPILHRLEDKEDFGDVYRRARHRNPSMTMKYAKIVGVEIPEWAEEESG